MIKLTFVYVLSAAAGSDLERGELREGDPRGRLARGREAAPEAAAGAAEATDDFSPPSPPPPPPPPPPAAATGLLRPTAREATAEPPPPPPPPPAAVFLGAPPPPGNGLGEGAREGDVAPERLLAWNTPNMAESFELRNFSHCVQEVKRASSQRRLARSMMSIIIWMR